MRRLHIPDTRRWMPIVMLFLAAWIGSQARAGCGQRVAVATTASKAVVQSSTKTAVVVKSFALAVPVVVVSQPAVYYRYGGHVGANAGRYGATQRASSAAGGDSAADISSSASSIVAQSCVTCHGGTAPKAGLDLSDVERLTPDQRLKAVARVVSDDPAERMPPGQALSPGEIGRVLQELSE